MEGRSCWTTDHGGAPFWFSFPGGDQENSYDVKVGLVFARRGLIALLVTVAATIAGSEGSPRGGHRTRIQFEKILYGY